MPSAPVALQPTVLGTVDRQQGQADGMIEGRGGATRYWVRGHPSPLRCIVTIRRTVVRANLRPTGPVYRESDDPPRTMRRDRVDRTDSADRRADPPQSPSPETPADVPKARAPGGSR